jgi:hypothetical protein
MKARERVSVRSFSSQEENSSVTIFLIGYQEVMKWMEERIGEGIK